ncbi:MAG: AI-2E family transporter [Sandaracinaceae bacterium]
MPLGGAARSLLTLAALVIVLAGLRAAAPIATPILLALLVAFVSSPAVFRLTRWGIHYGFAVSLVLLFELAVLGGLGSLLLSPIEELRRRLPTYQERFGQLASDTAAWLEAHGVAVDEAELAEIGDPAALLDLLGSTVASVGTVLTQGVLFLLIVAFTLFDASRLWKKLEDHYRDTRAGEHVLSRITDEVNRYLGVKSVTSGATGFFCGVWCEILGVDFAVLWGLLAFLLNYIPNVGAIVATIPPFLISLAMFGPGQAALVVLGFTVVNMVIGSVIEPRIMGQALGISPVVVILSMVVWGWVLGPVGALISVPLTMVLKMIMKNTEEWAWLADLMSDPLRRSQLPVPRSLSERASIPPPPPAANAARPPTAKSAHPSEP